MDAIDAFDLERGVKFETYCVPRIRGAMLDELRTMDWVPRLVRSKHTKMEEARKSLEAELGRPPTPDEMAAALGVSLEEFEKMAGDATAVSLVSLNKKWYETDSYKDVREIDILEDKKAEDPTHRLQNRDLMRLVTRGLNRNERLIIILYYYEDMTMKEIGATLDLSESRVSQMHSSIVARLQAAAGQATAGIQHLRRPAGLVVPVGRLSRAVPLDLDGSGEPSYGDHKSCHSPDKRHRAVQISRDSRRRVRARSPLLLLL